MLTIRREQVAALRAAAEDRLVGRICDYLRDRYPAATLGDDLAGRVRAAVERGRGRGFVTEAGLAFFAVLTFELGPAFDEHPRVRAVLDAPRPADPMARLLSGLTKRDWEQVAAARR